MHTDIHAKPANLIAFAFLLIAFLTGIASAFQLPTLSLFLSKEIQVSPLMVGCFYSINAVIGITVSQLVAAYSDKQDDRRKIMIFCCLTAVVGCLIFAYIRNYYILVLFGTVLIGLGSASNPQTFAFAREYAESSGREAVMFTTILRTQISLAWIVGPPLSFMIATNWGFNWMYLVAALAFLFCAVITFALLPKVSRKQINTPQQVQEAPRKNRKSTLYLFIVCFLGWTCNSVYLINMPLYVINDLHLPEKIAGILMGTAAGLEIPVMLLASYLNRYISKKQLMFTALIACMLFYLGLLFAQETWQLLALQVLNAIFIGILATVGMLYFQDLMPRQMGAATTLFSNAAKSSWILGGPIAGIISQYWYYNTVFYVCIIAAIISVGLMIKVKSC
ncbi:SET family sugar efflux transporter-like MFS transporter [Cricetibacter osteomyelitidis]|uniref:SET family sugar efflux transporter-like MFS transporter n=1 Tax=Cricetibacter osteomyelitidis TaxID=1521931 RepID=A0A4R2TFL5_9PAST|nr:MFS transporter [Cricetibacter osteomyelitidis]TCP93502.1 SET family sugar efflux transporter-like MFS transporter [Cricetibacter osteomyelitidis]